MHKHKFLYVLKSNHKINFITWLNKLEFFAINYASPVISTIENSGIELNPLKIKQMYLTFACYDLIYWPNIPKCKKLSLV